MPGPAERSTTIRAAVCRAFDAPLAIENVVLAPPGAGEVRVRLAACAICHSDISYMDGLWGGDLPAVWGHEAAGTVVEPGPGCDLAAGSRVVVTLVRSCGGCRQCVRGNPVACSATFALDETSPITDARGQPVTHGMRTAAFAEEVVVHESQVVVIPDDVPMVSAALLACGVITGVGAAVNTAGVEAGSTVVVVGCGGVGLNVVQGARLADAATIIAVDLEPTKLDAALAFGATHAVEASSDDVAARIEAITDGAMADYVFVAVGAKSAIEAGYRYVGSTGALVIVGMPATGVVTELDPGTLAARNQRILGSKMGSAVISRDIPELVRLYQAERLELDGLVSRTFGLADINEAIADVKAGTALRNVIVFDS